MRPAGLSSHLPPAPRTPHPAPSGVLTLSDYPLALPAVVSPEPGGGGGFLAPLPE